MRLFLSFKKQFSFVILVALVLSFFAANAQIQSYTDSWGSSGISLKSESKSVVTLNFSITEFQLIDNEVDGLPMKDIIMPQVFLPNDEGAPNLPALSRYIAVPQGAQANIIIKSYRTELLKDISIAPAPRIPLDTEDGPLQYRKNEKIYNSDAYYPAEPFLLSELTQLRGVDAVMFGITPFQYNPISKELLVYRDVELDIVFEGGNGHFGDDRLRSRWYDPILEDALLNSSSLPVIDYDARIREYRNLDNAGFEYLIVIPNDPIWMPYAEQIKEWRTKQGILTGIKTLNDIGGSTVTILENYFNNAFNNWTIPPVAVLLMADYGTNANNSIISPIYGNDGASDNIFADVTGNHLPDMIFARMTAQNATHLQTMVSKMLNYESNPPTNPNFYNNPITALGWHTDRWFQICSEVVGGFWRQQGKLPVRINGVSSGFPSWIWSTATNTSQVVNYFGPNGQGYIPATPAELGGFIGGTAQMVVNAINSGAFALQHRDHGYEDGWGEPAFKSSHIDSLKNNQNNELVYVFSINSLTGKYNMSGECFAEKFHRHTYGGQNAGALGVIAASEAVYSFVSDVFLWGMFDNMYPEFMPDYGNNVPMRGFLPAFGQAAGKIFLQSSQWPYNSDGKESTYNLFHAHGGAFLQVFTEVPQNLAVTHNPILYSSESSFSVIAPAGAFISLTVNGEIIGTAMSNGGSTNIAIEPQLPPNPMVVTVTKQNYYRYESNVDIISPSGPCVIADSFVINDASGNNNGLMDYGESIMLHMTMKNVGMAAANNVSTTMTSNNAYVTITNGNAYFGNIAPNSTVTVNNAFSFTVSPNIPDSHAVSFILNSTDGADNWISYISIVGHAPNIKFKQYVINDEGGNGNGLLDPGEIAPMTITVENQGSLTAYNVVGMLTTTDPNVTILTSQPQSMDDINAGGTSTCEFIVSASANIPAGYTAALTLNLNADFGVTQQTTFYLLFPDYCYPTANCSFGDGFTGFALEQINNMTGNGCSPNGYGDYTNMVADLQGGQKYTVQWRSGFSGQRASLWIDLNDNKEFESSEILINEFELLTSNQVYSTIFTVPEGDYTGYRRIRIRAHFHNTPPHSCGYYKFGETEDYTANFGNQATLAPPQNVAANVIGDSVVVTWQAPERADATLLGYNVYRNNILLDIVTGNEYFDLDLPAGTYSYEVTAVYYQGESEPAGPVTVSIIVYGVLTVTPGSLDEVHSAPPQLTTKILTLSNTGNGPIEFDAVVDFLGKGNRASVAGPDREIDPKWVAEQYEQHAALERYPNPASDNVHNVKATAQPVGGEHYTSYITSDPSRAGLYNNGPFITHPGGGAGGKDASAVQTNLGMNAYGPNVNHNMSPGNYYYLADDFEVTGIWNLEAIKFYAYQTGSGATSTFTGVYVQIWDGAPNAGGVVVWGDLTTNRMISTYFIDVYRVLDTDLTYTGRPIMEIVADMSGCILNAGTYWVQWGLTGSASSGPWGVPVTILGQTTTGNGLQATSAGWQNWQDGGTSTGQGGAFIIKGTAGAQPAKDVGVQVISAPNTGVNLTGAEEVKFIIKNYGTAAQSNIPWTVTMSGQGSASFNGAYAGPLASGATAEITAGMANLSAYGIYNFEACTNLAGDEHAANNCKTKAVTNIEPSLCVDNLYSNGCSFGDGLTSWDFANINVSNIPCSGIPPWYHDYRDMVHEVEAGHTYVLTVTAGYTDTYFDVWIDFNDDFVLSNVGELILNDAVCATANTPYTFNITIPMDAPGGTHVIRYRTNRKSLVTDPCATYNYGNAVDFKVSITSWLSLEPSASFLNAGESMNVFVFFNSAGLDYGVYNADILFASNNPFITQPEVTVPVQLTVGGVPSQDILMPLGWSGWSAYINMLGASFENVVAPVVNDMIITQHFTEVFWPQYGINTMGNFTNDHGYVSKMSAFATLSLEGMVAAPTVALNAGWNLFPILVDCNLSAAEVFGGITGFIIGYEVAGNGIYYPVGSIATLTTLVPGKAYWVKVSGAATYTFPECIGGTKASYIAPLRHANNTPWNEPTYTGSSHIVVFDAEASVSFAKGDMIGAFTNDGACAGLTLCDGKAVSLALFADDITTLVNDGFVQGEFITFKLFRQSNDTEYILDVSYSNQAPNYDGLFEANGLSVINNVTMYATGIASQDLNSLTVYPNPSQGIFNVSVNNLFQDVNWVVTDAKGRYVLEGRLADSHQIDLRTQPKGIYFIKFTGDNVLCIKKLVLR